jgi:hypothetical protein
LRARSELRKNLRRLKKALSGWSVVLNRIQIPGDQGQNTTTRGF